MATSVSKRDIVATVAERLDWPKREVATVLDAALEAIGDELAQGNKVSLTGYITFGFAVRKAVRKGTPVRNPFSGETQPSAGRPTTLRVKAIVGRKLKERAPSAASKAGKAILSARS